MEIVQFPSLEEFKASCSKDASYKSVSDKLADSYDKLPRSIRLLKNLDPTGGFISYFADTLSEIKAERNEEKLWKTLYELFKALHIIYQKQGKINPEYFESQVIALTEMYFDHSMRAYQIEKIEILKNAFVGGVLDYNKTLDEKENIFNIVSSLTIEQICILKYCYDNKDKYPPPHGIQISVMAHELKLSESYVDQLCLNLEGKGLLFGILSSRPYGGGRGYGQYIIGDFLDYLIKYIKETT